MHAEFGSALPVVSGQTGGEDAGSTSSIGQEGARTQRPNLQVERPNFAAREPGKLTWALTSRTDVFCQHRAGNCDIFRPADDGSAIGKHRDQKLVDGDTHEIGVRRDGSNAAELFC